MQLVNSFRIGNFFSCKVLFLFFNTVLLDGWNRRAAALLVLNFFRHTWPPPPFSFILLIFRQAKESRRHGKQYEKGRVEVPYIIDAEQRWLRIFTFLSAVVRWLKEKKIFHCCWRLLQRWLAWNFSESARSEPDFRRWFCRFEKFGLHDWIVLEQPW